MSLRVNSASVLNSLKKHLIDRKHQINAECKRLAGMSHMETNHRESEINNILDFIALSEIKNSKEIPDE